MSHLTQDWKPVVLHNLNAKNTTVKETTVVKRNNNISQKNVDIETNRIDMISPSLKKKLISVRLNYRAPNSAKPGIGQQPFAQLLGINKKEIELYELSKITQKRAKQIALIVEHILKIKVL